MIQQTIQEVKFEDIILSKKQRQARKSNKLRHWLQYLNMLDENKDNTKKNSIIKQMHSMFILNQTFWTKEVTRVLKDCANLNIESFQFAFMALEDGFYIQVAHLIAQKLFEAFISEKIRINFVIAKIQILISQFDFFTKQCALFFDILIKVYTKTNNVKKIRETFQRQISMGFDDYDVTYTQYIKWQQNELKISSFNEVNLLQKGKLQWERSKIFIEDELSKIQISQDFLSSQKVKNNKRNIKLCLLYLEDLNTARIDQKKYMKLLQLLSFDKQKVWYLRRLAMSQTHELVQQYFQALQLSQADEQQIINAFKRSLIWQNGQKYEMLYLSFLIRRINKHILKPQSQEYNSQWGSNVEHFRNEISELISKQRLNSLEQKKFVNKYYNLWIDTQMALIKDKATVEQLFESLLNWGQNQQIYINFAYAMIKLGDVSKAKWILNKTFEKYGSQGKVAKQLQKFLSIYGALPQIIKFKQTISVANLQKIKEPIKIVAGQLYHKENFNKIQKNKNQQNNIQTKSETHEGQCAKNSISPEIKQINQEKSQEPQISLKRAAPVESHDVSEQPLERKKIHLDSQNTLFSSKVKKNWGQADIMLNLIFKQNVNQIRIIQKQNQKICYIEFDSEESAQKQINQNKSPLNLAFSRPPSKSDDKTLFLCNLPLETNKEQIIKIIPKEFQDLLKQIRCKQKNGKKTAYIEFNSQQIRDEVLSELKRQKIKIGDKSIIAMSCSNNHKDSKQKKNKTVFLKNLSFKCKQKDLKKYFQQKGLTDICQVFIPKDEKSNRSKGFAYIQFGTHEDSQKAYDLQKGELLGRQFVITRSDRVITHQQHYQSQKNTKRPEKEYKQKPKQQNGKSNNFFSNIFS